MARRGFVGRVLVTLAVLVVVGFTALTVLVMLWVMLPPSARRTRPIPVLTVPTRPLPSTRGCRAAAERGVDGSEPC